MSPCRNNRSIHFINVHSYLRGRTWCNLLNILYCVKFISWINTFWRISCKEINIKFQSWDLFHYWQTFILCNTRINRRLINNHISFWNNLSYSSASTIERCQIRSIIFINRGRNSNYIKVAITYIINICSTFKSMIFNGILK